MLVGPGLKTGMPIRIDNPHELGADRLVNAVAAYDRVGGACIAVDFGTAINYDVVSAEGEYLGGVISPGDRDLDGGAGGPGGAAAARRDRGARATRSAGHPARRSSRAWSTATPARWTAIVGRLREELGDEATAIATGGLASAIVPFCEQIDEVDDLLTLTGLKLVFERNSG